MPMLLSSSTKEIRQVRGAWLKGRGMGGLAGIYENIIKQMMKPSMSMLRGKLRNRQPYKLRSHSITHVL